MNVRPAFRLLPLAGFVVLALVAAGRAGRADASVVVAATRVIYPQQESEVTLKMNNVGTQPSLVQAWIDNGDPKTGPATAGDVPFTITPPVARIDPGKGQTLRIVHTGEALPQDRESVYWLNVLDIPPKPAGDLADANRLQLAFRSRIKLFFRPQGLPGEPGQAPSALVWRVAEPDGRALLVHNPGVYHVSIVEVTLTSPSGVAHATEGDMVGPGETKRIALTGEGAGTGTVAPGAKLTFRSLNDYGGPVATEATLLPGPRETSTN